MISAQGSGRAGGGRRIEAGAGAGGGLGEGWGAAVRGGARKRRGVRALPWRRTVLRAASLLYHRQWQHQAGLAEADILARGTPGRSQAGRAGFQLGWGRGGEWEHA